MDDLLYSRNEMQKVRESLSNVYNSKSTAHGAYLLTIAIAFFTFIQILSYVKLSMSLIILIISLFPVVGLFMLTRTVYWGIMTTVVLWVKPLTLEETRERGELHYWLRRKRAQLTLSFRLHRACHELTKTHHKFWMAFGSYKLKTGAYLILTYVFCLVVIWYLSVLLQIYALI
jgi:hypothetical protein